MRWMDPNTKEWESVFDEGTGKEKVTIERGERDIYRVRYWRGDTEATIHVHGETPEELADNLINEGMFAEDEARAISSRIVAKPPNGRSPSAGRHL